MARGNNQLRSDLNTLSKLVEDRKQSAIFKAARKISEAAHEGQFRRDGRKYFLHTLDVAKRVKGWDAKIVGILHDTFEDTPVRSEDLRKAGIPENVIAGVEAMTHDKKMPYLEYIEKQVKPNALARAVKLVDLKMNMVDNLNVEQMMRYRKAYQILTDK